MSSAAGWRPARIAFNRRFTDPAFESRTKPNQHAPVSIASLALFLASLGSAHARADDVQMAGIKLTTSFAQRGSPRRM